MFVFLSIQLGMSAVNTGKGGRSHSYSSHMTTWSDCDDATLTVRQVSFNRFDLDPMFNVSNLNIVVMTAIWRDNYVGLGAML